MMSKFLRDLLIGIVFIVLGIWLSVTSRYFLFYGLMVAGLVQIIQAFAHLAQSRKRTDSNGLPIKAFYPTDKPQEKARFIQNIDSQEDLDTPKQG